MDRCERRGRASITHFVCWLLLIGLVVGCQSESAPKVERKLSGDPSIQRLEATGLHNLFRVSDRILSGSSPEGDAGFASLQKLGIKTIISVDGAKPDVTTAAQHGMEYVHLPFGYDGVPRIRVLELAKVAAVRPGPFYVHCHHGLHRGPVAVAIMRMCDNSAWDADTAELWLQQAGTSPQYPGLVHMPRNVGKPTKQELSSIPNELPVTATVSDIANMMVEVDARWDRLKLVKAAGWRAPEEHPDIDPSHEAVQLVEHYREAGRLEATQKRGPAFTRLFNHAESEARQLESELRPKPVNPVRADAAFARSAAQCAACHNQYRDRPQAP